ncbi:MAG TPA: biotin-dependent carboxyltransferase family protein [Candidatus Blautia avistercoris]|nr:biotin-dependent carboxyltransferase family protein [Candidatus Blautia avistercoris]
MSVKVKIPGALTTVQDAGRYGYQKSGISTSGVMDADAYEKANYLVGNEQGEAVLEMTVFGGTYEFTEDTVAAVTGAQMELTLNQQQVPLNCPIQIHKGDSLTVGIAKAGLRGYLAVAGGFDVPVVMGSRSTNQKCRLGGLEGRALAAGDELPVGKGGKTYQEVKERRTEPREFPSLITIRVIEGPQAEYFTEKGKKAFYSETYTISEQSDRMGYRLEGPSVESKNGTDIVSDGIALGSVQIPPSGKPIVLLADRQTTGGYAKVATVYSRDIPRLVQGRPGEKVRFVPITLEEAQKF